MRRQDLLSSLRQFQRRVAIIGSVAYLIANNPGGLVAMSRGAGDRGEVKPWNLLVRRGGGRDLGGRPGCLEVAFGEGMSGDEVSDVDDAADQMVVESVTLVQPNPPSGPQLVERLPGHQLECLSQVVDAIGAAGFSANSEAAEQVGVDQEIFDLIDADAAGAAGVAVSGVGQVFAAGAGVHAEPVTEHLDVVADPRSGDGEGVGDLFGGGAVVFELYTCFRTVSI